MQHWRQPKNFFTFFFLHYTLFLYCHSSSVFNMLLRGCYFSKLLTKPTFLGKFYHWNYESDFVFLHNLYSSIYHCYQGLDLHWGDSLQNTSIFPLFAAAHSVHTKSLLQLSPLVYSQIDKVKLAAWIFFLFLNSLGLYNSWITREKHLEVALWLI